MDTKKMRACSPLLPDPGGEVVRECLDEIERLRSVVGEAVHWAEHAMLMRSSQNKELLSILQGADTVPNSKGEQPAANETHEE